MTEEHTARQEPDVIAGRRLVLLVLGVLSVSGLGVATSWALLASARSEPREQGVSTRALAESKGLEHTPFEQDAHGLRVEGEQHRQLAHFGWVDRDAGVARIPIERAMDLTVERERR